MFDFITRFFKLKIARHYWNIRGVYTYYGQKIYFPKNSVIFNRVIDEGIYEHSILSIINPLIKPNTEVFDIGANIGIMSIPLLTVHKTITLISAEASPNSLPFLKKTNDLSIDKYRWTIIDKAISENEGKINLYTSDSSNGAYDSLGDTKRIEFTKITEIECTTIDKVWHDRNKPLVSFIKSDIEGADLLALKGGYECIESCKPSILIEWNSINIKPFGLNNKELFDFTQSLNYIIYALPHLNKITTLLDLELHSNYTENLLLIPNEQIIP